MPEFFNVLPPDEARALLFAKMTHRTAAETIPVSQTVGRVTAVVTHAPFALPAFRRSTMDGYAVRAVDTYGASGSLPAFLNVIGEVAMGEEAGIEIGTGEAVIVHTGGMVPDSADAVVQVEHTQVVTQVVTKVNGADAVPAPGAIPVSPDFPFEIEVFKAVAVGQNVLQVGEDVAKKSQIFPEGHFMRPQDLGGLLAVGITEVAVAKRPLVGILATGDEVVHPTLLTHPGQIRDINSFTISGMVQQAGGIAMRGGIVPDDFNALQKVAANLLAECDMLVLSAGSSVSVRDMTVDVVDSLGEPGVLLHGVATRPGKPTIVGVVGGKPVIGLPGNPVSAMVQFDMFGVPAIYQMQGLATPPLRGQAWATLAQNVASESGREDYIPVRLEEGEGGLTAVPVFGKSNLIYTLVNADGLIKVPLNKAGLEAGETVAVRLF